MVEDGRFVRIITGPEAMADAFDAQIAGVPGFQSIPLEPEFESYIDTKINSAEMDKSWEKEKEELAELVNKVVDNLREKNELTEGFTRMYRDYEESFERALGKGNYTKKNKKEFSLNILGLLVDCSNIYYNMDQCAFYYRIERNGSKVKNYKWNADTPLHPRAIRIIIGMYGLNGEEPLSDKELAEQEGVSEKTVKSVKSSLMFRSLHR